jgi:hypothetical protein
MAALPPSAHKHQHSGLVVILKDHAKIERGSPVQHILDRHHSASNPIFGSSEELTEEHSHLAKFHRIHAAPEKFEEIVAELNAHDDVDAAYIKPAGTPPVVQVPISSSTPATTQTKDFTYRQNYLNPGPVGVDALTAHTRPGGKGDGVNIIDCEWGWQLTHEDLQVNVGSLVYGSNLKWDPDANDPLATKYRWKDFQEYLDWVRGLINHGTGVVGVIKGDLNPYGITGIAPNAIVRAASFGHGETDYAACVFEATKKLNAGDILLLEIHQPGPKPIPKDNNNTQYGYIPFEWWPDQLKAVQEAVKKGIIVVEAAGNGAQDLDDPIYDKSPDPSLKLGTFPPAWKNPLNPHNKDAKGNSLSGAILVGAGCPPPETHENNDKLDAFGQKLGPDRSRCSFSNYGARVDCQAQGWQVTSTGYGDLKKDQGADKLYTDRFSGTSSASPIIVGVLASIQGMLKRAKRGLLTPDQAVKLLRENGWPQQDGALEDNGSTLFPKTQRIGNRPDLKQLIGVLKL